MRRVGIFAEANSKKDNYLSLKFLGTENRNPLRKFAMGNEIEATFNFEGRVVKFCGELNGVTKGTQFNDIRLYATEVLGNDFGGVPRDRSVNAWASEYEGRDISSHLVNLKRVTAKSGWAGRRHVKKMTQTAELSVGDLLNSYNELGVKLVAVANEHGLKVSYHPDNSAYLT